MDGGTRREGRKRRKEGKGGVGEKSEVSLIFTFEVGEGMKEVREGWGDGRRKEWGDGRRKGLGHGRKQGCGGV